MKMKNNRILLALLASIPFAANAQQLDISAQLRTRTEYRDGYRTIKTETAPQNDPAYFLSQRTRVNFLYTSPQFEMKVTPQDVHVWGSQLSSTNTPASFGLYEAWGAINLDANWKLKIGRQEIIFDDQRLMGNLDWAQGGRSFDALTASYKKDNYDVQFGGAFNQVSEKNSTSTYVASNAKVLGFIHPQIKTNHGVVTATVITDAYQANDTDSKLYWRFTQGLYTDQTFGNLMLNAQAYYQAGNDVTNKSISAYLAALKLGYKFNKVIVSGGADILSGTNATSEKNNSFNTLYATNHKFYGWMDYYIAFPADVKNLGLNDYYLTLNYLQSKKLDLSVTGHFMTTNKQPGVQNNKDLSSSLGQDIDLGFNWKINDFIKLNGGYSFYLITSTTEYVKGTTYGNGRTGHWGWLALDITPKLFSTAKK